MEKPRRNRTPPAAVELSKRDRAMLARVSPEGIEAPERVGERAPVGWSGRQGPWVPASALSAALKG